MFTPLFSIKVMIQDFLWRDAVDAVSMQESRNQANQAEETMILKAMLHLHRVISLM